MTATQTLSPNQIAALVFLVGLGMQQVLHVFDNFWTLWLMARWTKKTPTADEKADATKSLSVLGLSVLFGLLLTSLADIRLLSYLPFDSPSALDFIVTTLFLSSGSQAANSIIQYAGYLKESAKRRYLQATR